MNPARFLAIAICLVGAARAQAQSSNDRWTSVDEKAEREIEWDSAPAQLRDTLLTWRKANAHCTQTDAPYWQSANKTIYVHKLSGEARALFQVCGAFQGGRIISHVVAIADGDSLAKPRIARLQSLDDKRKLTTSGEAANLEIDARGGGLRSTDPLDRRGEYCQQRDRKSTRLNSSHIPLSRMPSSA